MLESEYVRDFIDILSVLLKRPKHSSSMLNLVLRSVYLKTPKVSVDMHFMQNYNHTSNCYNQLSVEKKSRIQVPSMRSIKRSVREQVFHSSLIVQEISCKNGDIELACHLFE